MEAVQLSFVTLPGVSTSYSLTIGSNNNAMKEVKIVSAKKYRRLKKKNKKKKKTKTVEISPIVQGHDPEELKKDCEELADKIDKHNDILKGMASLESSPGLMDTEDDLNDPSSMVRNRSGRRSVRANYL